MKYTITGTSVTDDFNNIRVDFEGSAEDVDTFSGSIVVSYNVPTGQVFEMINSAVFNAITGIRSAKKAQEKREKEKDRYKPLKDQIDSQIGIERDVKKPKKDKPDKEKK
jgi:hypothetical protein